MEPVIEILNFVWGCNAETAVQAGGVRVVQELVLAECCKTFVETPMLIQEQ